MDSRGTNTFVLQRCALTSTRLIPVSGRLPRLCRLPPGVTSLAGRELPSDLVQQARLPEQCAKKGLLF